MTVPADVARRTVSGGVSVAEVGDGPAVFLMHGIGGNARSCAQLAEQLAARGRRAVSWDAPGYGDSADPVDAVDYPNLLVEVLDALMLDRVDLFGTSWGGVIATLVAAIHPDRVRTLLLADSTRGSGTNPNTAAAMRARPDRLAEIGAQQFAAERAPRLVAPGCAPAIADVVRQHMAQVRIRGYRPAAQFMADTDTRELLPAIRVPTLVLVGEHDVVTGVKESQLLASRIPGAKLIVLPEAGHAALTERPAEMAREIDRFWAAG
jgi:pimeloyl-ACP methyl ester carboxylesterase